MVLEAGEIDYKSASLTTKNLKDPAVLDGVPITLDGCFKIRLNAMSCPLTAVLTTGTNLND